MSLRSPVFSTCKYFCRIRAILELLPPIDQKGIQQGEIAKTWMNQNRSYALQLASWQCGMMALQFEWHPCSHYTAGCSLVLFIGIKYIHFFLFQRRYIDRTMKWRLVHLYSSHDLVSYRKMLCCILLCTILSCICHAYEPLMVCIAALLQVLEKKLMVCIMQLL
jgi:hypothetical protein